MEADCVGGSGTEIGISDMENETLAQEVVKTAQALSALGLNVNKAGNVSVRGQREGVAGFLITPTGVAYETLQPEDLPWMPIKQGLTLEDFVGHYLPSSEWQMHAAVYETRADVQAVVHTHSAYATALACQNLRIPAFHYMVAVAGGSSIDVVPYATFGSEALAKGAALGLAKKNACLLEHHGVMAVGVSLARALALVHEVENLAHQYVIVRSLGEPRLISEEEMARVAAKFTTYGQPQSRQ